MVRNDFSIDLKRLMKQEKMTQVKIGEKIGISGQAVSVRALNGVMAKGFVEVIDALGYDIEVRYVKRESS